MFQNLAAEFGIGPSASVYDRIIRSIGFLVCISITIFILGTTAIGKFPAQIQYGVMLTFGLIAVFILKPGPLVNKSPVADKLLSWVMLGLTLFSSLYFLDQYDDIADMREGLPNKWDIACYIAGTLVVLEGARRVEGMILLSVVGAAIIYMVFGEFMPGLLSHRPFEMAEVLEISYSYQGIYGVALGAVVDVVLVFVVLGVALRLTGAGDFFNFLALRLTKGKASGPAQCAILASAMFGSVNGSAPANVSATGVLTIPMMKRAGYPGQFAGGVEATASCVGQIMPPIMGVGAFIMSEVTGIPYTTIMLAALVPAFLFICSLSLAVALEAGKLGIKAIESDENLAMNAERWAQGITLISGFGILIAMLFSGFSPTFCGLVATGVVLVVANTLPATRMKLPSFLHFFIDGGKDGLSVMISCAAIGIVIGAVTTTGLGIKLNQMIVALGGESLLLALILAAICSIILGMGLPTAASYLMVVFVAGPAIMKLGVPLLQTHLYVFYYAVLSAITPPVALAVFAASAIAKASPIKLAGNALKLSIVAFVLPIAWIYHPEINLQDLSAGNAVPTIGYVLALVVAMLGVTAGHIGFFKHELSFLERFALIAAGAAILAPNWTIVLLGVLIIVFILGLHYKKVASYEAS